jgi:DNA-binding NtrC family response regulator
MKKLVGKYNSVMVVSSKTDDHDALQQIFSEPAWELRAAFSRIECMRWLGREHQETQVVICENCLPDGDWRLLLAEMDQMAAKPSLIIYSPLADEGLWAEVINLGAFDLLLGPPFEVEETLRVTRNALLSRVITSTRLRAGSCRSPRKAGARALSAGQTEETKIITAGEAGWLA